MEQKINYSRNTVGCRIGGEIFIHPELYKYPILYMAVIAHEKGHTDGVGFKDIKHDLFNTELEGVKGDFYKFMLFHPRTLLGWLPLTKIGKYWAFDLQLAVAWILCIAFGWYIGGYL